LPDLVVTLEVDFVVQIARLANLLRHFDQFG